MPLEATRILGEGLLHVSPRNMGARVRPLLMIGPKSGWTKGCALQRTRIGFRSSRKVAQTRPHDRAVTGRLVDDMILTSEGALDETTRQGRRLTCLQPPV